MRPEENNRSWSRLDGVDLLRGLAIFFVLMNHVNMRLFLAKIPYTHGLPHQLISSLFWNGQCGVQIFFAVSGFLITSTSLRRWGSLANVSVRDFYLLRFARIAPLLLLLLLTLSILHLAGVSNFVVAAKTGGLARALFAALTFHINVLEARRGYLPGNWDVLWSLSVEEMFYLFFPVVCWLFGRTKLLVPLLCILVLLGPFARTVFAHGNEVWQEYSYLGGMDAIALGCLTALITQKIRYSRRTLLVFSGIGAALLILILCCSRLVENWGPSSTGLDMSILAIGTCLLITAASQTQWRVPVVLRPLTNLGQRSYEIYLTHMFVVFAFFQIFVMAGKSLKAVPLLFGVVILVAALLGDLTARFYSEPLNRLLRKKWGDGPSRLGSVVETETASS
ncbi:MAG TPA: acyltransferase [Candidatus Acidoferrales bacterium]